MPSVREREAWLAPASREQAVGMTAAEMDAEDIRTLAAMVVRRGYTAAELAYAMEELMYDEELDKKLRFKGRITPADFERVISAHRRMRRRLEQLLSRYEVNRLIDEYPNHLCADDFGVAGYTSQNEPLYRFKRDPQAPSGEPRPFLEDDERPGADRQRTEGEDTAPVSAGEAAREALKQAGALRAELIVI